MRSLALFLIGLLVGACAQSATVPVASPSKVEAAADLTTKTVALVQRRDDGSVRSYCTGVWVSETAIVTALHCVAEEDLGTRVDYVEREDIYAPGELTERPALSIVTRAASFVAADAAHDLALLKTNAGGAHGIARVSSNPVRSGQFAQAMGHSMGLWWSYSSGDVAAVRAKDFGVGTMLWVQATTPISPGNSGGGLFDENGFLIGLADGALGGRAQNLNLFVHPLYIEAFIRPRT